MRKKVYSTTVLVFFLIGTVQSQGILGSAKDKAKNMLGKVSLKKLGKDPISTSFADTNTTVDLEDTFGNDAVFDPLCKQPKDTLANYVLTPGFYDFYGMSFCLKAGTYGPSEGDGYLYAATQGKQEEIVIAILKNYEKHLDIPQRKVQLLLWAIIAKTNFKKLSNDLRIVSARLLTPKQLLQLNNGVLGFVPEKVMQKSISKAPPAIKTILEIENKMRGMFEGGISAYEDYEKLAILAGMAPPTNTTIKRGRWSLHPDGYYIRYFPEGYSRTRVEIYVPDTAEQVTYNASDDIAVPANTGAQRLAQCNIALRCEED